MNKITSRLAESIIDEAIDRKNLGSHYLTEAFIYVVSHHHHASSVAHLADDALNYNVIKVKLAEDVYALIVPYDVPNKKLSPDASLLVQACLNGVCSQALLDSESIINSKIIAELMGIPNDVVHEYTSRSDLLMKFVRADKIETVPSGE